MLDEALPLPVMTAIAHQCFNAEYVFEETEEERAQVDRLRERLGGNRYPSMVRGYAAYRPLHRAGQDLADRVARAPADPRARGGAPPRRRHSVVERRAAAVSAQSAGAIRSEPVPALGATRRRAGGSGARSEISGKPRILVAGCGTGQHAIATAQRFPGAACSRWTSACASLAYAQRKTLELGITDIEYRQADILALDGLRRALRSDRMLGRAAPPRGPVRGLARARRRCASPADSCAMGLYSETGRRAVVRARELIAAEGFAPDAAGIRACRAAIRARSAERCLPRSRATRTSSA